MHPETAIGVFTNSFLNPKNEITNAIFATNSFAWTLDPIGNRISATKNQEPENYSANQLNQYTQISDGVTNYPTYDLDGNMLTYSGWTFTWNGENRLIQASNATHVISYSYDYQGRMFQKVVDGVTNTFIWDGFNIVAEIQPGQTNFNVWGLDLSGSLQGAGGIGGLLSVAVAMPSAPCAMHFSLADGNGNITEYVATNGSVVAHREYSAFGETLVLTGTKKDDFTFWFSTKPYDPLTKISHYQMRDYWAELGRWLTRDPIEEWGGVNIVAFVRNDPLDLVDETGLVYGRGNRPSWTPGGTGYDSRSTGLSNGPFPGGPISRTRAPAPRNWNIGIGPAGSATFILPVTPGNYGFGLSFTAADQWFFGERDNVRYCTRCLTETLSVFGGVGGAATVGGGLAVDWGRRAVEDGGFVTIGVGLGLAEVAGFDADFSWVPGTADFGAGVLRYTFGLSMYVGFRGTVGCRACSGSATSRQQTILQCMRAGIRKLTESLSMLEGASGHP